MLRLTSVAPTCFCPHPARTVVDGTLKEDVCVTKTTVLPSARGVAHRQLTPGRSSTALRTQRRLARAFAPSRFNAANEAVEMLAFTLVVAAASLALKGTDHKDSQQGCSDADLTQRKAH